ncbi:MAG: M20/M25/M40 family metallo-hydrolase [Lachnospiraceae bacterium]|nr:M20/M25/M40 family metallo-hydrolase [Lachnospiraceae bacterium]
MINEKRLLDTFLDYVQIDSETKNEKAMGERLVADLKALGLEVQTDHAGENYGSNGCNVHAFIPGTIPGDPVIMCAHMDTVVPGNGIKPIIEDGVIRTDGSTILAGDDKSGIASIMEAARVIKENNLPCRSTEILFTISEEGGMMGAKNMDYGMLKGKEAMVFDASGDVGKIITCGPGQIKIFATIIGRSSHAGLAPEDGISAIQVAAKGIAKMNLLRIDEETTCNIGTLKAEYATNIVPDKVEFIAEVRSRNLDKLNAQADHIRQCLQEACDEMGAALEYDPRTNYVSFNIENDDPLIIRTLESFERLGIKPVIAKGGGGSDANVMALHGIKAVVLSTGMAKVHTTSETITIDNLNKCAELVLDLMTH